MRLGQDGAGGQADDRACGLVFAPHDACIHANVAVFIQHRAEACVEQGLVFHRFNGESDRFQGVQIAGLQALTEVVEQRFHAGHALGVSTVMRATARRHLHHRARRGRPRTHLTQERCSG